MSRPSAFRWQDGERLIVSGRGQLAQAPDLLGDGCALLTTLAGAEMTAVHRHAAGVAADRVLGRDCR